MLYMLLTPKPLPQVSDLALWLLLGIYTWVPNGYLILHTSEWDVIM